MSESESEEFTKKLTALLKERDRARVAIFDLHMAVSKAEEMRDRGVESAKAAGSKILELQGELSALKTELGAASRILGEMTDRAEAAEKRSIALQGVVERVREEISKAEIPEITEEQLEASRKALEGSRIDPTTGDLLGRGLEPTIGIHYGQKDTFDQDDNEWDPLGHLHADEKRGVLTRRSVSLARFGESFGVVKILGVVSYLLGAAIGAAIVVVASRGDFFSLVGYVTGSLLFAWALNRIFTSAARKRDKGRDHMADGKILLFDELKNLSEVPPPPADDTLTQAEAIFGDPDEDGGN